MNGPDTPHRVVVRTPATTPVTAARSAARVFLRKHAATPTPSRVIKVRSTPVSTVRTPARTFRVHSRRRSSRTITPAPRIAAPETLESAPATHDISPVSCETTPALHDALRDPVTPAERTPRASARVALPRRLFAAATPAPKIRVAGGTKRTQPSLGVGQAPCGPLSARLAAALEEAAANDDGDENAPSARPRALFVKNFDVLPLHQTRVSFVARCCAHLPETHMRVLVDQNGCCGLLRAADDDSTLHGGAALWKDVRIDDSCMPVELVSFLLDEAQRRGVLVGERPVVSLRTVPLFLS